MQSKSKKINEEVKSAIKGAIQSNREMLHALKSLRKGSMGKNVREVKLDDSEKSTVTYQEIKSNPFADIVFGGVQPDKTVSEQLSNVYNT